MNIRAWCPVLILATVLAGAAPLHPDPVDPATQAKINEKLKEIQSWAKEPAVVQAVLQHNAGPTPEQLSMSQERWSNLTILDLAVRQYATNNVARYLKTKRDVEVVEIFINGSDGRKVAFTNKTTYWCHRGKPKHDVPMTGKVWQGEPSMDISTGLQLVQIGVPIFDPKTGQPIGSLVAGLATDRL